MHRSECGDLPGLHRDFFGKAERTEHRIEGVAEVPELGVELVVVPIKKSCRHLSRYVGKYGP